MSTFNPAKIATQAKGMLVHEIAQRKTGAHMTPKAKANSLARENTLQFIMKNLEA